MEGEIAETAPTERGVNHDSHGETNNLLQEKIHPKSNEAHREKIKVLENEVGKLRAQVKGFVMMATFGGHGKQESATSEHAELPPDKMKEENPERSSLEATPQSVAANDFIQPRSDEANALMAVERALDEESGGESYYDCNQVEGSFVSQNLLDSSDRRMHSYKDMRYRSTRRVHGLMVVERALDEEPGGESYYDCNEVEDSVVSQNPLDSSDRRMHSYKDMSFKSSRRFSTIPHITMFDESSDTDYSFQDSIYFQLMTQDVCTQGFIAALAVVIVSVGSLVLVLVSSITHQEKGNRLGIPYGASTDVHIAQVLGAIIGVLTEQETVQGIMVLYFSIKSKFFVSLSGDRMAVQIPLWKVYLSSGCFLIVGYLFLVNLVFVIAGADDVLELFFDILALEFVLHVDDLAIALSRTGILGWRLKNAADGIRQLEMEEKLRGALRLPKKGCSRIAIKRVYFVNLLAVFVPIVVILVLQQIGTFVGCKSVTVTFGDETWEGARVKGDDKERVLLYSYFSGVYRLTNEQHDRYPRYVEQNKENGKQPLNRREGGAEIIYCRELESWVFMHPKISKSKYEAEEEDGCKNWLARSSVTTPYTAKSFDLVESAEAGWDLWVGTTQTGISLSIACNECESAVDCNYHGSCDEDKQCQCEKDDDEIPLYFGEQCQLNMPCEVLVTENIDQGIQTQLLQVKSEVTDEGFVKSYDRPIYTVNGLSLKPEALLGIRSEAFKSRGKTPTELKIDEVDPFEDDDFFPESMNNDDPLTENFFEFGSNETLISQRNYAVILAFSGLRWFGIIDRPDFNLEEFFGTEYHAFWQNTYSERTFLVSAPTSNDSPIGVEFFSPRRRKSDNDYGPFGVLLPLMPQYGGVGFFQCYAKSNDCNFLDINVSTQNKSLPSNLDEYFSGNQRVSWQLVRSNSSQVEAESTSVLLGANFNHKYCLIDGTYRFQMSDEVCKSSWWECEHGSGKSGYSISINGHAVQTYGTFQESKSTFSLHSGTQGSEENWGSDFCSEIPNFNLTLFTDGSPYETSWLLTSADGSVLLSGGPYPFYKVFATYNDIACLVDGRYNLTIFDAGGDGMKNPGYYDLMVGGEYLVVGEHLFGDSKSTSFTLSNGDVSNQTSSAVISSDNQDSLNNCSVALLYVTLPTSSSSSSSEEEETLTPFTLLNVLSDGTDLPTSQSELAEIQSENILTWSLLDVKKQLPIVLAQPMDHNDPKAPCLYEGSYTHSYESSNGECVGDGLTLHRSIGQYNLRDSNAPLRLWDGQICRNETFSYKVNEYQDTYSKNLEEDCMNDFHLIVPKDAVTGSADTSWELSGRDGVILQGDQFGDSSTFFSHRACLRLGTYIFTTWKDSTDDYILSYRKTSLEHVKPDLSDLLYPANNKWDVFDGSELSFSLTDVGDAIASARSSTSSTGAGVWIVEGSGNGIGDNSDAFRYLHTKVSGDTMNFTVFVENFSSLDQSKGGIMFRDTLGAGSRHYSMFMTSQNGLQNSHRRTCRHCETFFMNDANVSSRSAWLSIAKDGNQFSSFYKEADANEWKQFGSTTSIHFSSADFHVGIAVASHNESSTATLKASNVELIFQRDVRVFDFTLWEEITLPPHDGAKDDKFGLSAAYDSDTIVVTAYHDNGANGQKSGSAYLYMHDGVTWKVPKKILASDGRQYDEFGSSIAIDGDSMVIGAFQEDNDNVSRTGCAYAFLRDGDTWREQTKLIPLDGVKEDEFGRALALSGNTLVITALGRGGSAYVFSLNNNEWKEQDKLLPHDGTTAGDFGTAVAMDGSTVIIADLGEGQNREHSGSVYVFVRNETGWQEQAKLVPPDWEISGGFGSALALSGNTAIIADAKGDHSGSAYVFVRIGARWTVQAKLLPSDGAAGDEFGTAVAFHGNTVAITAIGGRGSVYVFVRKGETWNEQGKLLPDDVRALGNFGAAVALQGDTILVTATGDDVGSNSVHTFSTPLSDLVHPKSSSSFAVPPSLPPSQMPSSPKPISPYPTGHSTPPQPSDVINLSPSTSPFSTTPHASASPTTQCMDTYISINVFSDSTPEQTGWTLSRVIASGDIPEIEIFFRDSAEYREHLHKYSDKMCLERGDYRFMIMNDGMFQGRYNMTLDGTVIAQGGRFRDEEIVPFSIPFISSPSASPSTSLSPTMSTAPTSSIHACIASEDFDEVTDNSGNTYTFKITPGSKGSFFNQYVPSQSETYSLGTFTSFEGNNIAKFMGGDYCGDTIGVDRSVIVRFVEDCDASELNYLIFEPDTCFYSLVISGMCCGGAAEGGASNMFTPTNSAMSQLPNSEPSMCEQGELVEVSMSFNEYQNKTGWIISQYLKSKVGDDDNIVEADIASFFPWDASLANDESAWSICLEKGTYKFVVYDTSEESEGVSNYSIKSGDKIIARGEEIVFEKDFEFDIPYEAI